MPFNGQVQVQKWSFDIRSTRERAPALKLITAKEKSMQIFHDSQEPDAPKVPSIRINTFRKKSNEHKLH